MRVIRDLIIKCLILHMLFFGISAHAEPKKVGQVYDVKVEAFVIRDEIKTPVDKPDDVFLGDILGVDQRRSRLQIALTRSSERRPITIKYGRLRLAGISELTECEMLDGVGVFEGPPKPCNVVTKDFRLEEDGTLYEVHVQAQDSRVFVYDGSVSVFSTNPAYPQPQLVQAGEWVRARKGEPIPAPTKFMLQGVAAGPGSGSTECIYSNCNIVDDVRSDPPEGNPFQPLIPPPPNPPGRR
jgi:hypothetical protein